MELLWSDAHVGFKCKCGELIALEDPGIMSCEGCGETHTLTFVVDGVHFAETVQTYQISPPRQRGLAL